MRERSNIMVEITGGILGGGREMVMMMMYAQLKFGKLRLPLKN